MRVAGYNLKRAEAVSTNADLLVIDGYEVEREWAAGSRG